MEFKDLNPAEPDAEKGTSTEEKTEIGRTELLSRVVSGNIQTLKDRVAFVLNNSIDARNSDKELAWAFWQIFDKEKFDGKTISKVQFKTLTPYSSVVRERAKIQNVYKLFQADTEVQAFRGVLEEEMREEAIESKLDDLGLYSVYVDETGKTQDYVSVGSLWILKSDFESWKAAQELTEWKKVNGIKHEFHFAEMGKSSLESYKQFFQKFLALHPEASFKVVTLTNKGLSDIDKAITDLTVHLLIKGIDHENDTGRAPLPRVLQVWIDEDEKGKDKLKLENMKERLKAQNKEGLRLANFEAVSSKDNDFIQVVDLFTGAVNRKLHPSGTLNHKDEFADFVLNLVGLDLSGIDKDNTVVDNSILFNLR